jgi:hypothetical protein
MIYTVEQRAVAIETVLNGLRNGTPLTVLCSADGMPNDDTIRNWAETDPDLKRAIARARERGFDAIAMDGMTIVDNTEEDPASRRVRADYRLKLLAKWDPKRYGEMLKLADNDGGKLDLAARISEGRARIARAE